MKKEFVKYCFLAENDNQETWKSKHSRLIQKMLHFLKLDNLSVASASHFDPYFHLSSLLVFQIENRLTGLTAGFAGIIILDDS